MKKNRTNPLRYFILKGGTYDYNIVVCFCEDRDKVAKWLNKRWGLPALDHSGYLKDDFEGAKGRILQYNDFCPLIWMPRIPMTPAQHATAAHEILHAVVKVMRHIGMPLAKESEEAYCHLMTHLTNQFYEKIK